MLHLSDKSLKHVYSRYYAVHSLHEVLLSWHCIINIICLFKTCYDSDTCAAREETQIKQNKYNLEECVHMRAWFDERNKTV